MLRPDRPRYTVEEYLWQEQRAEDKHEYYDGAIYAMAGGSLEYSQIQSNLILEIGTLLRGSDCRVLTSDLKIGIEAKSASKSRGRPKKSKDFVTYPDTSVICGQVETFKGDRYTAANPLILFEVLSPSTRNYDTGFKLEQYQQIPSLRAYIMIDSERVWVRSCLRIEDQNLWILEEPLEAPRDTLRIEALEIEIPLSLLYAKVEFEEADEEA